MCQFWLLGIQQCPSPVVLTFSGEWQAIHAIKQELTVQSKVTSDIGKAGEGGGSGGRVGCS
jgi:hypothetical protein